MSKKILSVAVLLAGVSMALAQDVPIAAPVAAPPLAAPAAEASVAETPVVETPAVEAPIAAPVVEAPTAVLVAPVAAPVAEAPAAKPSSEVAVMNLGGTKISLYGFLQLNAVYESGANGNKNWTEIVPSGAEDGEGRFMSNVNQTRIGFNLAGPQKECGPEVSGRFEADFGASNDRYYNANTSGTTSFRIRQSYGQLKFKDLGLTLLMGQTSDVIAPLSAPTLNQGGLKSQGSLGTRRPMIRLSQALGPVEITAAATDDRVDKPVMPGFQGSVKAKVPASWAGEKQNVELTLSGHYAAEESAYDNDAGKDAKDADGWGTPSSWSGVASLSLPIIDIVNLSGEFFLGQNLKNYNNGSLNKNGVATGGKADEGVQSMGGWGAANIKLPAGFALAGGIGLEAIDEKREIKSSINAEGVATNNPNKNMVIFANLKYAVAETAFIGFEYANLSTDYADRTDDSKVDSGKMNRFELVFNYGFK